LNEGGCRLHFARNGRWRIVGHMDFRGCAPSLAPVERDTNRGNFTLSEVRVGIHPGYEVRYFHFVSGEGRQS